MDKLLLKQAEQECCNIDKRWLFIHFLISVGAVLVTFILECIISRILYNSGDIHTSISRYLFKYLIIPNFFNCIFILVELKAINSKTLPQVSKIFIISLSLVSICSVIFTVHSIFSSLFFIFSIPILLTAIYGNYKLSTVTAIFALVSVTFSEFYIRWDIYTESVLEDGLRLGNFIISIFVLISFYAVSMVIIFFERKKAALGLKKEIERYTLRHKLKIDELTQIYNRSALRNSISEMEEDTSDNNYIFVMLDIDNFKILNDSLGHISGDNCLKKLSYIMQNNSNGADIFRYGGDEFCILFKNYTISKVIACCERIQFDFKKLNIKTHLPITLSFGLAEYDRTLSSSILIMNSDTALYNSKIVKNKITVYNKNLNYSTISTKTVAF